MGSKEVTLQPPMRKRLYEQVAEQIMVWVKQKNLGPGDRLPPERELASGLSVSRATVSQALVALEVIGAVEVQHGSGAVLKDSAKVVAVAETIRRHTNEMPAILDARDALETKLASLAAERRTAEDLARIDAALTEMAEDIERGGRGVYADGLFHSAITAAARSPLLAEMMAEVARGISTVRLESLSQHGRPQQSLAGHRRIADAIRHQKPEVAAAAMHDHLLTVGQLDILVEG